ncbi:MAG: hypothetical protein HY303_21950 [Candidatus Wallbacteria bacterium]|nr:hypothetical protein [Candidatus Wallbacteria bacterium]
MLLDLAEGRSRDLRIGGQVVPVACRVGRYSLSAHADGAEVAGLLGHLRPLDVVLVHGEGNARPGLARAAAPQVRDGVYLPSLGDTLEFAYRRPRERVVLQALPGFGKERLPDGPGLAALAGALRTRGPEGRLFDVRELAQYWAGPSGGGDSELRDRLRGWLDAAGSPFEADARRPFLYRLRKEPAVPVEAAMAPGAAPAGAESGPLEQTAATAKIDALLPSATGLYRKSFRVEERRVELCFEFPAVAARLYAETIGRLCEETGWTVSVYPEVRLSSLFEAVSRTVPSDWQVARQPAYHREKGLVVLHIASVPPDWQEQTTTLSRRFEEETGLRLVFERGGPEDAPVREQRDAEGRIEINQAMAALDRAFRDCPHRPGKKSRKTDAQGPYLELGFISPAVAVRYTAAIEAVAREIGWRVVVGDRTDQIAILSVFRELWPSEWPIRKGPSLHVAQGRLAVVSGWQPPAAELAPIAAALKERTGFELVVG